MGKGEKAQRLFESSESMLQWDNRGGREKDEGWQVRWNLWMKRHRNDKWILLIVGWQLRAKQSLFSFILLWQLVGAQWRNNFKSKINWITNTLTNAVNTSICKFKFVQSVLLYLNIWAEFFQLFSLDILGKLQFIKKGLHLMGLLTYSRTLTHSKPHQ